MPTFIDDRDLLLRMLGLKADDFVDLRHVGLAIPDNYKYIECIGESGRGGRGPHYDKNEAMRQHPLAIAAKRNIADHCSGHEPHLWALVPTKAGTKRAGD